MGRLFFGVDMKAVLILSVAVLVMGACSPEVGSKKWCEAMKKKPEGDWTMNEAKDYAKNCLFK